jgi:surface antigen
MKFTKIIAVSLIALSLVSCAEQGGPITKQGGGTVLGALGGAIIGSNVGKGQGNIAAIAIGALAGAALGNSIGASLDRVDKQYMMTTSQQTLESARDGQTMQWRNPNSGNSGTITPTNVIQTSDGRYCREYTQTVNVAGKNQQAYGKACRQQDGTWQIAQ